MTDESSKDPRRAPRIAVLGAGPAGLAAAHTILAQDSSVRVDIFESSAHVGGCVRSVREHGLLYEIGPNTMNAKHAAVYHLIHSQLGLTPRVRERSPLATNFFVVLRRKLVPLPRSIHQFISSPLLSTAAKLRILAEPFVKRLPNLEDAREESIDAFFTRRFGREITDVVIDPAVAGIFSGRISDLSMMHAFHRLWTVERRAGSVIAGMLRGLGKAPSDSRFPVVSQKALRKSFSFDNGLQVLTDSLAKSVESNPRARIKRKTAVTSLDRSRKDGRWLVNAGSRRYDAVVSTIPAHDVKHVKSKDGLVKALFAEMARKIVYAPVAVVLLVFKESDITHKLDGFGFLVPSSQRRNGLLGVNFSSANFPERVEKPDELYVTAYIGGSRDPDKAMLPASKVIDLATAEIRDLIGSPDTKAVMSRVKLWRQGIPQYNVRVFDSVLENIKAIENKAPGLVMAGNYRDGIGLPDALLSGIHAADRALESVTSTHTLGLP